MMSNWYERRILPAALDVVCGMPMISRMRQLVVPHARGRVLEVGIGTGLNMRWYDKNRVTHITGLDPSLQLHPLARERIAQAGLPVDLIGLSAEMIPLPDVVATGPFLCPQVVRDSTDVAIYECPCAG